MDNMEPRATPPVKQDAMREALEKAANAWDAFGVARSAMNASIPAVNSTPAERALYDERYKADHEAQREHWRAAVDLAQSARSILAALSAPNVAGEWTTLESVRTADPYDDCLGVHVEANALSTPQPESVEAAVERVTYAIILGSSGERAADHAKEFQTANWEDARRSAIAVIKAMPAATTQPGPDSWVPADQFVTLRHERDGLRAALAEAIEALNDCRVQFEYYANNHRVAGKFDKAATNQQFADMIAQVVAKHGEGR